MEGMEMETITTKARKAEHGWIGYIQVNLDQKPLYCLSTGIVRLTKDDAKQDAEILKSNFVPV